MQFGAAFGRSLLVRVCLALVIGMVIILWNAVARADLTKDQQKFVANVTHALVAFKRCPHVSIKPEDFAARAAPFNFDKGFLSELSNGVVYLLDGDVTKRPNKILERQMKFEVLFIEAGKDELGLDKWCDALRRRLGADGYIRRE